MIDGTMQDYALTLDRFLNHAAKWHPQAEVVTAGDTGTSRIGYAALRERSNRLSGALAALGMKRGDRLAILAWNTQAHMECWYAAVGIGAIYHTLNPRLSPEHLAAMIHQAGNRILAVSAGLGKLAEELVDRCPTIEHVILLDEPESDEAAAITITGARAWHQQALLDELGSEAAWGEFDEHSPAGLCFTSGTTGAPKGVTYTHRSNYLHTIHLLQADVIGLGADDAMLVAVPMFHANGWGFPFAGPGVGAKLVLPGRHLDGPSLARLIETEQVTVAAGVATIWLGLVDHLDATGRDLPTLKRILLGGSSVPQALIDRLEDRLGVRVQTSWGMTELSPLGTVTPASTPASIASSAGRPPIGVDMLVTDAAGTPLAEQRGVEGHLRVKGASVVARYFGQDDAATDADGWFDTGDLAVIDHTGRVSITGRAKDLIKSGGEWINPGEIEAIVGALPQVALVAVIGRTHAKWGERPVVVIEQRRGLNISDEEIHNALNGRVASWWIPDDVIRVPAMPLAMTGKIDKKNLRALYG